MFILAYTAKRRDGKRHIVYKSESINACIFYGLNAAENKRYIYRLYSGSWTEIGRFYRDKGGRPYFKDSRPEIVKGI